MVEEVDDFFFVLGGLGLAFGKGDVPGVTQVFLASGEVVGEGHLAGAGETLTDDRSGGRISEG